MPPLKTIGARLGFVGVVGLEGPSVIKRMSTQSHKYDSQYAEILHALCLGTLDPENWSPKNLTALRMYS